MRHRLAVVLVAAIAASTGMCVRNGAKASGGDKVLSDYICPSEEAVVTVKNFHTCLETF